MTNNGFKKEELEKARIIVAGCGALGNEVLKNLALMGVGNLVIVDFDNVEPHNLGKSVLFSMIKDSPGRPKVEVASEALKMISPGINIKAVNGDISADVGLGEIRKADVVIGCVDNRLARYCINRLCMRAGVPWIDGGISGLEGMARIFEPGKNCYACTLSNEDIEEMKRRLSCAANIHRAVETGRAPTTPLVASVIGAVQAQEAIKLVHNKYSNNVISETLSEKMLIYDGNHLTFSTVNLKAYDDECSVHEEWRPVIKASVTEKSTIKDVLSSVRLQIAATSATLLLINDCFVDYIYDKATNEPHRVMLPGRRVEEFIRQSPILSRKPLSSYYQNEIRSFHRDSPYLDMTLEQIGIPPHDILKMRCGIKGVYRDRDFFIEMK